MPNSGVPLLPSVDGEALLPARMKDSGSGEKVIGDLLIRLPT